jgi:NADH-quinone oxidoreductase subunit D
VCGICSGAHTIAYVSALERLGQVEIPQRAAHIRTIIAELERIHSHMLWFGVLAHEVGLDTLFHYVWRDREVILDLLEKITGNRVNYSINKIGGVRRDIDDKLMKVFSEVHAQIKERTLHYIEILKTDKILLKRLEGIGILEKKIGEKLAVVGPTARGSNIKEDIRKTDPYLIYGDIDFTLIHDNACDSLARASVRLHEILESLKIINASLPLPEGSLSTSYQQIKGEAGSRVEAPRGELFYFVIAGKDGPKRVRIRTPTYANFLVLKDLLIGANIADIPVIVASIDPCISCTDRLTIIKDKKQKTMTFEEFKCYLQHQ